MIETNHFDLNSKKKGLGWDGVALFKGGYDDNKIKFKKKEKKRKRKKVSNVLGCQCLVCFYIISYLKGRLNLSK